jgi:hypothetical protein
VWYDTCDYVVREFDVHTVTNSRDRVGLTHQLRGYHARPHRELACVHVKTEACGGIVRVKRGVGGERGTPTPASLVARRREVREIRAPAPADMAAPPRRNNEGHHRQREGERNRPVGGNLGRRGAEEISPSLSMERVEVQGGDYSGDQVR